MKKFFKYFGIFILVALVGLVLAVAMLQNRTFDAPYPEIAASTDSAVIAHGKYLFYGPAHCLDCHSSMEDVEKVNAGVEVLPKGGRIWNLPIGIVTVPNITSDKETGIGARSDKDIARALRYGVSHNGRALFDMMPFHNTSDEDLTAILSYLRTLPPSQNPVTTFQPNAIGKVLNAFVFKPVGPDREVPAAVTRDSSALYGEYLATSIANCRGCHSDRDLKTGAYIGPEYAGGFKMPIDGTTDEFMVTCNLTPDPETGRITDWTEEQFIARFRQGKKIKTSHMPWGPFKTFADSDLKAIYRFLKTLKPIKNETGPVYVKS